MATATPLKRLPYSYAGSKRKLMSKYIPLFPPHQIYLSVFLGSGADFAVKPPSPREIGNDLDGNVYAFFAALRNKDQLAQLMCLLENAHSCRREYEECFDRLTSGEILTLVERAYCWLVCGNLGFRGHHPLQSRSYTCNLHGRTGVAHLPATILAWRDRMRSVEIENLDAFDFLDRFDREDVFAFCDPPYHPDTLSSHTDLYSHTTFDHRRFLKRLQVFSGKAMVCGYDHSLYDLQLLGWRKKRFRVKAGIGGKASRTEFIWMNYDENGTDWNRI